MATNTPNPQSADVMSEEDVRQKILHILTIYPVLSPTMLQGGLGVYMKPAVWRPVLQRMIEEELVIETKESKLTPSGRYNSYTKLHLPNIAIAVNP